MREQLARLSFPSDAIGTTAGDAGITLWELSTQSASLEEAYMALTEDEIDYRSTMDHVKDAA